MQLRAMRIRKGRQQKELAKAIGTDEPMMSKFENYKCLPIPPMMKALCDELGCEVGDICSMKIQPTRFYIIPRFRG